MRFFLSGTIFPAMVFVVMRDAIIEKLTKHFSSPPESEADIIYAFVQVQETAGARRA